MPSQYKLIVAATLVLYLALYISTESYAQEQTTPRTVHTTLLNSIDNNQCPSDKERERGLNETSKQVRLLLSDYVAAGPLYECNGTPGWRRIVFINMTDTSYNCPPGLNLTSYSKRTCGRAHTNWGNCSSTTFSIRGFKYSRVCGRIRGYQVGDTDAFWGYLAHSQSIDSWYVEGVSLTHGPVGERQHIWTFAAGLTEANQIRYATSLCPCDILNEAIVPPPFVATDYFCESGKQTQFTNVTDILGVLFQEDPLWDGYNCPSTSTCCQFNNPPWFTKNLPNTTTDDIELRLCTYNYKSDTPLELIELYIQ